jgi:polycomb group RING finger protein 3
MVIIGAMERRIKLKTLNSHITCKICRGYLIDATTVTECLHTFCKSCLVKHLEEKHTCPTCQIVIHQSHPLQYISFDRTMQDIVYKLVPDLQESKKNRPLPDLFFSDLPLLSRKPPFSRLRSIYDTLVRVFR